MFVLSDNEKKALIANYEEAISNPKFRKLVKHIGLTKSETMKRITKVEDTLSELENCQHCKSLYECKNAYQGHVAMLKKEDDNIYSTYVPCRFKKEEYLNKKSKLTEEQEQMNARMADIDVTDKRRAHVIRFIDNFYENYNFANNMKGLYLHGNFGCGKTFLLSALLHELHIKKGVKTSIIYYPEILRELKADWETYDSKVKYYSTVDILAIDDIGAEKVSEWSRDEVLGTILQTRMNHNLTTFFTSNLTLEELERHFKINDSMDEQIKAKRIMERIKQLSVDMELLSENKRN